MPTLPSMRSARAVTIGLALAGAVLVGPAPVANTAAPTFSGIAADEPGLPPPPEPAPEIQGPANQGPANYEGPAVRHRRHHGDPVMGR